MATRWVQAGARVSVVTAMPNRPKGRIYPEFRGHLYQHEEWNEILVHRTWVYASPKHGAARTVLNNLSFLGTSIVAGSKALHVDVLIASSPPFFPHLAGAFLHWAHRTPLVLEVRDLWPDYMAELGMVRGRTAAMLFRLERWLMDRAAAVVVVTEPMRRRVIAKGVAPDRVLVIPNGVDTAQYHAAPAPVPIPALERKSDEFIVGYLGNFGASQRLDVVVEAAAKVAGDGGIRVVMAGDGTDRASVEAAIARWRPSNVTVAPGIAKIDTRAFYNACDVCLVPLAPIDVLDDALPSKLFEIMACQVPVLGAVRGEAARVIRAANAGYVAPPGDAQALASGMLTMRDWSSETRQAAGRSGRTFVEQYFERERLAEEYLGHLVRVGER